ncbi:SEL1-like repeat protein [bacterium]|nr:SEL1-like repeat protein [bacterium]MBU1435332.1 SEL1-like repeat protein [bacterium]MBU1503530.1 SEL1-like repeat protein [bacterium]
MNMIFDKAIAEFELKHYNEAYELFEQASELNPNAMVNIAIMHMRGQGCKRSNELAKEWFLKAAEHDNTQALNSLGIFYEKGMLGDADAGKALEYYKRAADLGHIEAQLKAGLLFKQAGNNAESMRYLITAAHNINAQAQSLITYVSNASEASALNKDFRSLDEARQRALVESLIETQIRPTLASDGGGIELVNFVFGETPQIWLSYLGACSGCQLSSTSTADMLLDKFETMIDKNVVLYLM